MHKSRQHLVPSYFALTGSAVQREPTHGARFSGSCNSIWMYVREFTVVAVSGMKFQRTSRWPPEKSESSATTFNKIAKNSLRFLLHSLRQRQNEGSTLRLSAKPARSCETSGRQGSRPSLASIFVFVLGSHRHGAEKE